jgi:hypothetical protein
VQSRSYRRDGDRNEAHTDFEMAMLMFYDLFTHRSGVLFRLPAYLPARSSINDIVARKEVSLPAFFAQRVSMSAYDV